MTTLDSFDMEWVDFKDFIKEKVVYERVLNDQLQVKMTIDFKEIENFYYKEYRPQQESWNCSPCRYLKWLPRSKTTCGKFVPRKSWPDG